MQTLRIIALLLITLPASVSAQRVDFQRLVTEDVRCAGNEATSCEFIRSHVRVAPGDVMSEEEVANAQLRLSSLRNFESVSIHLEKGSVRDAVIVVIEVKERGPLTAEVLGGLSSRREALSSVVAGRVAHQNLFGAGKIADATVVAITPLADNEAMREQYDLSFRYADPNLFGSAHYFAVASALWRNARREDTYGNFAQAEGLELDFRMGRRFGDFSYFTVGVTFRPNANFTFGEWKDDAQFEIAARDELTLTTLIYGWNSEDDPYFPTRGTSFHIGAGSDFGSNSYPDRSHVQLRKTWPVAEGFFAIKIGSGPSPEYRTSIDESQLVALNYSRTLRFGDSLTRGRWYVEPGFDVAGRNPQGEQTYAVGLKAGVRLDVVGLGIVDLFVLGTTELGR